MNYITRKRRKTRILVTAVVEALYCAATTSIILYNLYVFSFNNKIEIVNGFSA